MRKFFLSLVILIFLLSLIVGASAAIVRTDWFWKKALPKLLVHSGIIINRLDYSRKDIRLSGKIVFQNLKLSIEKDSAYNINISELTLDHLWVMIQNKNEAVVLKVIGLSVQAADIEAQQCQMSVRGNFSNFKFASADGDVSCAELQLAKNSFSNFTSQLKGNPGWLVFDDVSMNYREGVIAGRMTFGLNDVFPYVLDLNFHSLVLDENVFDGNVIGTIDGTFNANGFSKQLNGFEIVLDAPAGAKVRASLLQSIIPQLPPRSSVKRDLEELLRIGGYVYFETSHAVIRKNGKDTAIAEMNLKTKKLNLVLNPTVDINIEGGLQSVFKMIEFFSNPGG